MGLLENLLRTFVADYIGWIAFPGKPEEQLIKSATGYTSEAGYKFIIDDIAEIKFISRIDRLIISKNGTEGYVGGNKYAVTFTDGKKAIISVDESQYISGPFDQKCYL